MVVAPVSEILTVRGVDFVGTIPAEVQFVQTFAAAVAKGTKKPEASKWLIAFLASEKQLLRSKRPKDRDETSGTAVTVSHRSALRKIRIPLKKASAGIVSVNA